MSIEKRVASALKFLSDHQHVPFKERMWLLDRHMRFERSLVDRIRTALTVRPPRG